ncbi:MAG: SIMPL domain-containing protein [Anaerolineae bacterium]|nr:MAG: SIMPL domain-containing protein [Anaerolineae bacterium]
MDCVRRLTGRPPIDHHRRQCGRRLRRCHPTATPTQATGTLPRTITVVGEGKVTIKPDVARTQIGVEVVKPTVQEASSEAQNVMQAVLDALKAAGVAGKDIQTSGYNIWVERRPPAEGKTQDEVLYHVTNQVQVVIRNLDSVAEVLDATIDAGANNIFGVTFGLDDTTKVKSEARAKAIADGRAKAEELATLNGVKLGQIAQVSEVIGSSGGYFLVSRRIWPSPAARAAGWPDQPG